MVSIEEHKRLIKVFEEELKEKVRTGLLAERQEIVGFAASEGSINCLALFLHKKNLISAGFNLNHRWFASVKRAKEKLTFKFPHKEKILRLLVREEELRSRLCYGRSRSLDEAREAIKIFFEVKKLIERSVKSL